MHASVLPCVERQRWTFSWNTVKGFADWCWQIVMFNCAQGPSEQTGRIESFLTAPFLSVTSHFYKKEKMLWKNGYKEREEVLRRDGWIV